MHIPDNSLLAAGRQFAERAGGRIPGRPARFPAVAGAPAGSTAQPARAARAGDDAHIPRGIAAVGRLWPARHRRGGRGQAGARYLPQDRAANRLRRGQGYPGEGGRGGEDGTGADAHGHGAVGIGLEGADCGLQEQADRVAAHRRATRGSCIHAPRGRACRAVRAGVRAVPGQPPSLRQRAGAGARHLREGAARPRRRRAGAEKSSRRRCRTTATRKPPTKSSPTMASPAG